MIDSSFETKSLRMERMVLLTLQAPVGDVDRIMEAVVSVVPLAMGKYDSNAYQTGEALSAIARFRGSSSSRNRSQEAAAHCRGQF